MFFEDLMADAHPAKKRRTQDTVGKQSDQDGKKVLKIRRRDSLLHSRF